MNGNENSGRKTPRTDAFEKAWIRAVEDGVRKALGLFKVPRREELQEIERRLNQLSQRVDALMNKK
jgi:hypothetical protein